MTLTLTGDRIQTVIYSLDATSWNCTGANIMNFISQSSLSCDWPSTLTVTSTDASVCHTLYYTPPCCPYGIPESLLATLAIPNCSALDGMSCTISLSGGVWSGNIINTACNTNTRIVMNCSSFSATIPPQFACQVTSTAINPTLPPTPNFCTIQAPPGAGSVANSGTSDSCLPTLLTFDLYALTNAFGAACTCCVNNGGPVSLIVTELPP
jgi:hypothetical protein